MNVRKWRARIAIGGLLVVGSAGTALFVARDALVYAMFTGIVTLASPFLALGEYRDYRYSVAGFGLIALVSVVLAGGYALVYGLSLLSIAGFVLALLAGWRARQYYRAVE